ncbi:hypothetical protein LK540_23900 [Massilia sp. IC2-278]|uniref:hypothetical protein n=1 Tax=Massilia sp. IC2-278 TaxID=2887200 RepID=UPI001E38BDA3|nr:hypothetical protein [Massilia sp. IC2-278]MCC2963485.1 hypothetical protein [Massilia sp. IC2-278]
MLEIIAACPCRGHDGHLLQLENNMQNPAEQSTLGNKLMAPMEDIVKKHSSALMPMLGGSGTAAHAALWNDETVRKVATFCYPLLPGLVRLAIKEPMFVNFVLNNRERVLATLVNKAA